MSTAATTTVRLLPAGFEELEPFVAYWARETTAERMAARSEAPMADIRAFYDAMLLKAEQVIDHIDGIGIEQLPEDSARLARLLLALAQATMAVEIHNAPRAPGTPYPNSIMLARSAQPFG